MKQDYDLTYYVSRGWTAVSSFELSLSRFDKGNKQTYTRVILHQNEMTNWRGAQLIRGFCKCVCSIDLTERWGAKPSW